MPRKKKTTEEVSVSRQEAANSRWGKLNEDERRAATKPALDARLKRVIEADHGCECAGFCSISGTSICPLAVKP